MHVGNLAVAPHGRDRAKIAFTLPFTNTWYIPLVQWTRVSLIADWNLHNQTSETSRVLELYIIDRSGRNGTNAGRNENSNI